jgi:hypothetical protein
MPSRLSRERRRAAQQVRHCGATAAPAACPEYLKPCNAPWCPQSGRCLRRQAEGEATFAPWATRKGCPFFVDVRGVALLSIPILTTAPLAQGA